MERYEEKKRERRIRNLQRMVARARLVLVRRRHLPPDHVAARKLADNLKTCSRRCCANSRRTWGDRSAQECRQSLSAIEQLIELSLLDDSPGQRDIRRRGPWI